MPPPRPAARRFYRAFYRWSRLSPALRPATHPISIPARHLHTAHRLGEAQLRIRQIKQDCGSIDVLHAPPTTSAEKPFDQLERWQDIVRYRSDAGVMAQTAVPAHVVAQLERKYGAGLSQMGGAGGARVECGASALMQGDGGVPVRCVGVLYSGTVAEVQRVQRVLHGARHWETTARGRAAPPDARRREGAQSAAQQANTKTHAPDVAPPARTQPSLVASEPLAWAQQPAISYADKPRETMEQYSFVLRSRSENGRSVELETVVPTKSWNAMLTFTSLANIQAATGATITIKEPIVFQPTQTESLPILLAGTSRQAEHAWREILSARRRLRRLPQFADLVADPSQAAYSQRSSPTALATSRGLKFYARLQLPSKTLAFVLSRPRKIWQPQTLHFAPPDGKDELFLYGPRPEDVRKMKESVESLIAEAYEKWGTAIAERTGVVVLEEGEGRLDGTKFTDLAEDDVDGTESVQDPAPLDGRQDGASSSKEIDGRVEHVTVLPQQEKAEEQYLQRHPPEQKNAQEHRLQRRPSDNAGGTPIAETLPAVSNDVDRLFKYFSTLDIDSNVMGYVLVRAKLIEANSNCQIHRKSVPGESARLTISAQTPENLAQGKTAVAALVRQGHRRKLRNPPPNDDGWKVVEEGEGPGRLGAMPERLSGRPWQFKYYTTLAVDRSVMGFVLSQEADVYKNSRSRIRRASDGSAHITIQARTRRNQKDGIAAVTTLVRKCLERDGKDAGSEHSMGWCVIDEGELGEAAGSKAERQKRSDEETVVHRETTPFYATIALDPAMLGYVLSRADRLQERANCYLRRTKSDEGNHANLIVISAPSRNQVDQGKALIATILSGLPPQDGTSDVSRTFRVVEEGEWNGEEGTEHRHPLFEIVLSVEPSVIDFILRRRPTIYRRAHCDVHKRKIGDKEMLGLGTSKAVYLARGIAIVSPLVRQVLEQEGESSDVGEWRFLNGTTFRDYEKVLKESPIIETSSEEQLPAELQCFVRLAVKVGMMERLPTELKATLEDSKCITRRGRLLGDDEMEAIIWGEREEDVSMVALEAMDLLGEKTCRVVEHGMRSSKLGDVMSSGSIVEGPNDTLGNEGTARETPKRALSPEAYFEDATLLEEPIERPALSAEHLASTPSPPLPSHMAIPTAREDFASQRRFMTSTTATSYVNSGREQEGNADGTEAFSGNEDNRERLADDLKRTLRALTHPVVLITSRLSERSDSHSHYDICRGVTVSSFNTVTLAPTPIISFNLRVPSRSWDAINSSGRLNVHVLSGTPQGAALAHTFTQPYEQPGEPFRRLERMGVTVFLDARVSGAQQPPQLKYPGAIMSIIEANVLRESCIGVGDHIVVVAEVTRVTFPTFATGTGARRDVVDESVGLAYAMRGYTVAGEGIEPAGEYEMLERREEGGLEENSEATAQHSLNDIEDPRQQIGGDVIQSEHKSFQTRQRNANEADGEVESMEPLVDDFGEKQSSETEAERRVRDRPQRAMSNSTPTPAASSTDQTTIDEASAQSNSKRPKHGSTHPWGMAPKLRSYSTLSNHLVRNYNTSQSMPDSSTTQQELDSAVDLESKVADQAILSTSVADFLGMSETKWVRPRRIHRLMRLKKESQKASRRLEKALADGSITAEESAYLENVVAKNDRRIAKTLALRSAEDLKIMLDEGKMDVRRAQWLESSIEKGQAVLLEEAKLLKRMVEEKSISQEQFELVKERLKVENEILRTEALRLQMMVDEENEGGGSGKEETGFDGFKGNV